MKTLFTIFCVSLLSSCISNAERTYMERHWELKAKQEHLDYIDRLHRSRYDAMKQTDVIIYLHKIDSLLSNENEK
jgi:hypothetical protein